MHYKQLDSLRFFSVLAVMIGHWISWDTSNFIFKELHWGNGVIFFFVLSGFLITEILLKQKELIESRKSTYGKTLRNFYARRTLRIFPLYYILIFFLYYVNYKQTRELFPHLVTYTTNILEANSNKYIDEFNHFWSLAVEEQFYIFWPLLILFIPNKHILKFIISAIIVSVLSRTGYKLLMPDRWLAANFLTHNVMFALAIGALVAYIKNKKETVFLKISDSFVFAPIVFIVYLVVFILIVHKNPLLKINFILDEFLFSILSALVIARCVGSGYKFLGKIILENKVFSHLGKISYGLYLFHLFAIANFWDYISPNIHLYTDKKETAWALYFCFTYFAAEISYQVIERPFNYFKKYFV